MTPVEKIIRPIVEGQLTDFIKAHPALLNAITWFRPNPNKEEVFVNSVGKRLILDLISDETVGRLKIALLETETESVAHHSALTGGGGGSSTATPMPDVVKKIMDRIDAEELAEALIILAEHGIQPDVQELLVKGSLTHNVKPGALAAVLKALAGDENDALMDAEKLLKAHGYVVAFTHRQTAPEEPGWYYGRFLKDGPQADRAAELKPLEVFTRMGGQELAVLDAGVRPLDSYEWFGPVPMPEIDGRHY